MPDAVPFEVTPAELKARLDANEDLVLIDCREQDEWDRVRIEGAELMPLSEFAEKAQALADRREKPIVVHCHHGMRSARAANWLRANGYPQAQNLVGGIDAWSLEVDPSLPRY